MYADAAKELKELREQNARLKRLVVEAELEKTHCRRWRRENSEPSCAKRRAVDMLKETLHRLWREEGLHVRVHSPRKRAGASVPPIVADAPKVVWATDFSSTRSWWRQQQ
ncbi:hypothetical protein NIIDNTM18_09910 [Mycolicibacterium litorale]|uniref:Transposase n=1 Tax=Mycolicibacterium litorale TaxID=758802 RepID=A0A6S6NWW6_9MYCO|nr:hypothetical protein [Mycolicibacterium litorale]BCI51713.1 hypothetical protein NIIDNTM18_09910 [Mycolicibacterium litorale]